MYPRLLDFQPVVMTSLPLSMARAALCPMVVARGNDQVSISSKFEEREDPAVLRKVRSIFNFPIIVMVLISQKRNYGNLLVELCAAVPDGIVCFFTSYGYLENVVGVWYESGIINQVLKNKLIFSESSDQEETAIALSEFSSMTHR